MKITFDGDFEIRPESVIENYALRKWLQDWRAGKVELRFSWKRPADAADDGDEAIFEALRVPHP